MRQNLRTIVRGTYDLQALRIQMGNRLVMNWYIRHLGLEPGTKLADLDDDAAEILERMKAVDDRVADTITAMQARKKTPKPSEVVEKVLLDEHAELTDKRKRRLSPAEFKRIGVISDFTEFALVDHYVRILREEESEFRNLGHILEGFKVWTDFLKPIRGIGPAMAGVIISEFDIHRAKYVSSMWAYAGLDVASDGRGRSRKAEHLVEVEYTDRDGKSATRSGITFNPFLKTKLVGVLGSSFLKQPADKCKYRQIYDDHKHRLENHARYGIAAESQRKAEAKSKGHKYAPKGHRHNMAIRYMVKQFIADLYAAWKEIEGLPAHKPYHEAKLGMKHGEAA